MLLSLVFGMRQFLSDNADKPGINIKLLKYINKRYVYIHIYEILIDEQLCIIVIHNCSMYYSS